MRKVKSSIKSLQEAMTSLKQTGPFCVQEAKTHSFRAGDVLCSGFNRLTSSSSPNHLQAEPTIHMKGLPSSSHLPTEGRINSQRFFFSPRNTNSIMEEVKETGSAAMADCSFYEESEVMAMMSVDPYRDFKLSMAEMVQAHEIREWLNLQELLHCYLKLNDGKNHKIIVLAFADLVMQLMAEDREIFAFSSADPPCLCVCDLGK